jgi:uncharacterized membrane protein
MFDWFLGALSLFLAIAVAAAIINGHKWRESEQHCADLKIRVDNFRESNDSLRLSLNKASAENWKLIFKKPALPIAKLNKDGKWEVAVKLEGYPFFDCVMTADDPFRKAA